MFVTASLHIGMLPPRFPGVLVLLTAVVTNISGAPISNHTDPISNYTTLDPELGRMTQGWYPEPKGRGTLSILLSSLVTLIICVWTVLHMNVAPNATTLQRFGHKFKFVVFGVLAPEFVLITALHQFLEAKNFYNTWYPISTPSSETAPTSPEDQPVAPATPPQPPTTPLATPTPPPESPAPPSALAAPPQWKASQPLQSSNDDDKLSLEGVFFACMGGFALRQGGSYFNTTLTPEGFHYFTTLRYIQPATYRQSIITDKGKADFIGKLLVVCQALWLVVQCIVRKASGLPVTLLEVHVVLHVLCTVCIYVCWLSKPLDVREPLQVIPDSGEASLLTVIYGQPSSKRYEAGAMDHVSGQPPVSETAAETPVHTNDTGTEPGVELTGSTLGIEPAVERTPAAAKPMGQNHELIIEYTPTVGHPDNEKLNTLLDDIRISLDGSTLDHKSVNNIYFLPRTESKDRVSMGFAGLFRRSVTVPEGDILVGPGKTLMIGNEISVGYNGLGKPNRTAVVLNNVDIDILRRAALALRMDQGEFFHTIYSEKTQFEAGTEPNKTPAKLVKDRLSNTFNPAKLDGKRIVSLGIDTLPVIYGACHVAAWNTTFPTPVERWLWRVASLVVACGPNIVSLLTDKNHGNATKHRKVGRRIHAELLWYILLLLTSIARMSLVTESFLSLRHVPSGAFKSTPWDDYWPHL